MKVEFLYFEGCPNHLITYKLLMECLKEKNIPENYVSKLCIVSKRDAVKNKFMGSPSIRINDKDLEEDSQNENDYSIRCRIYKYNNKIYAYPPKELIIKVLDEEIKR